MTTLAGPTPPKRTPKLTEFQSRKGDVEMESAGCLLRWHLPVRRVVRRLSRGTTSTCLDPREPPPWKHAGFVKPGEQQRDRKDGPAG